MTGLEIIRPKLAAITTFHRPAKPAERHSGKESVVMLLDDFRIQIDAIYNPTIDEIGACADRYVVSLIAAISRWLQYTSRCSVLVVSRDGYILWARSSKSALRSGLFFKTRDCPPIEMPEGSLARLGATLFAHDAIDHRTEVWLQEPCLEYALFSDQYDFTLSMLHFDNVVARQGSTDHEDHEEDWVDKMRRQNFSGR